MLEIISSRTGHPTATLEGIHLHSAYDPAAEAERFIKQIIKDDKPSTIILLGAGLGYIIRAVQCKFPYAKLIPVFYSEEISANCTQKASFFWHPGQTQTLLSFLRDHINELDTEGLKILEWPASAAIFPELSKTANRASSQLLKELRGSIFTTLSAGKRWIQNSFMNFISIDSTLCTNPDSRIKLPIMIAASGPTLERAAGLISRYRNRLFLWALPSAVFYLMEKGLLPDLVVITDPSYYAMYHLHPLAGRVINLAMPLSASIGSWRIPGKIFLISQDNFFEKALLEKAGIRAPTILSHGTVAATAMELALKLCNSEIFFTGFDLCYEDIKSHARPNTFEFFLQNTVDRLHPFQSLMYTRAAELAPAVKRNNNISVRSSLSLETYAGWFNNLSEDVKLKVYRLNPTGITLHSMKEIDTSAMIRHLNSVKPLISHKPFIDRKQYPGREERFSKALKLLEDWDLRVKKAMDKITAKKSIDPLITEPFQLSLAYYIDPGSLTETKRIFRLKGDRHAARKALSFLEKERNFMQSIYRKIEYMKAYDRNLNS